MQGYNMQGLKQTKIITTNLINVQKYIDLKSIYLIWVQKEDEIILSLTEHLAKILNKISLRELEEPCPDWIELMINNGKITDTKLNDNISVNQENL